MRSFSFCGISLSTCGIYLAQKKTDWHIWESDYRTFETQPDSQDGAEWDGNAVDPKAFNLDCYFEEISILQLTTALSLFGRDSAGALVFDERPWLSYQARAVERPEIEKYLGAKGLYSGRITFHLKAYYPFASSLIFTMDGASTYDDPLNVIKATTGLIPSSRMPSPPTVTQAAPKTAQFTYQVHNAGNAKADTIIQIAGDVGSGVIISNPLTGHECKIIGLTKDVTTNVGKWLELDSRTGECRITNGSAKSPGWRYHDKGYVQLKGMIPIRRDIPISYTGNTVTSAADVFSNFDKDKWIFVAGKWSRIMVINGPRSVTINPPASSSGSGSTEILQLNELLITPISTMSLTKLSVIHSHTFT